MRRVSVPLAGGHASYAVEGRFVNCPRSAFSASGEGLPGRFGGVTYVFMTEFCGSTLLARLLAAAGAAVVLNEPTGLADAVRGGGGRGGDGRAGALVEAFLGGLGHDGDGAQDVPLVVKEQSAVSGLAGVVAAHPAVTGAVIVCQELEAHLVACLRDPARLPWKRTVLATLVATRPDLVEAHGLGPVLEVRDGLVTLTVEWLLNLLAFDELVGSGRPVAVVEKARLVGEPRAAVGALAARMGLGVDAAALAAFDLSRHSKSEDAAYIGGREAAADTALRQQHARGLARCAELAEAVRAGGFPREVIV